VHNTIIGEGGNDSLKGAGGQDTLSGGAGYDVLDGGSDADAMGGGLDGDVYIVDNAWDRIDERPGQGADQVRTSTSYVLTPDADVETLRTVAETGTDPINLTGNNTTNIVRGNNGNNTLNGREGNDELIGNGGMDRFLFDTPLNASTNVDRITNFSVTDDLIWLDDDIFSSSLTPDNSVAGSQFVIGTAALDAGDRIIYNDATGAVLYDRDGIGAAPAIQFATLSPGLDLVNHHFFVVA
jgi:Ca2+-binding RTX toxin-like protein